MRQWSLNPSCPPAPPFDCSLVTDVPQSECEVLVNLYSGANGSNWNDHTNRLHSTTVGNRYGITVSDGHVTQINLAGYMHMGNGLIGTADFSGLDNLQQLFLDRNQLSSINIAGLTNLTYVFADDNQLTDFDLDGLTNLDDLNVDGNRLSILNLSGLTNLQTVYANTNNLTSIDLDGLSNLDRLGLNNNQISDIDLSGLTALQYLYLSSNQLSTVNLSGLNSLINLDLSYNLLSTLPESTLSLSHLAQVNLAYNCRNPSAMSDDLISFLNEYTPDTSWLVGSMNDTCPVPSLDCATVTDIPQNECEALVSLYTDTNGNHWTQRNNRLRSTTASNRYGVTVSDGHVNTINLPNNGLQ